MIKLLRNAIVNWLTHQKPLPQMPLSDFERLRLEVQPCDVILIEGRSRVSEVIKLITQSSWSHASLYVGRVHDIEDPILQDVVRKLVPGSADQPLIIESELGLGTVIRPLTSYEGEHMRICRPRYLGAGDAQRIISYCIGMLGSAYDVRQVFDLARFLFPWFIMPRRWRSSLFSANPGKNTETVCSTMIAEAFGNIQYPILPLVKRVEKGHRRLYMRNPKLCTPRDFDYSPYFDIIKYPFLDIAQYAQQRLQPWNGTPDLSAEEREMYVDSDTRTEKEAPPGS